MSGKTVKMFGRIVKTSGEAVIMSGKIVRRSTGETVNLS